jgi:2-polyprenyl-6-methoxyphenol hydroxylase-like FAD-dependent oxidoreductase
MNLAIQDAVELGLGLRERYHHASDRRLADYTARRVQEREHPDGPTRLRRSRVSERRAARGQPRTVSQVRLASADPGGADLAGLSVSARVA